MDINQVAQHSGSIRQVFPLVSAISATSPAQTIGLPAIRPSPRGREQASQRREEALQLMQAQRAETLSELEEAYRRQLIATANSEAVTMTSELSEKVRARADAAVDQIAGIINATAPQRGRVIARLALLAGWPDKGGLRFAPIARTSVIAEQWKKEAAELRKNLLALDAQLGKQIDTIVDADRQLTESERADLAKRIKTSISVADERARARAGERLRTTGRMTLPTLLTRSARALPGQPASSLTVPGTLVAWNPAQYPPPMPAPVEAFAERLNIWLRIHGYKLAAGHARGVPDMTGEFIVWNNHP